MSKQRSGLMILSTLAMILSLTVPTYTQKREQDRSCTDHRAISDDKADKPEKAEKTEKRERIELRGTIGPDGKTERIVIEKPPN